MLTQHQKLVKVLRQLLGQGKNSAKIARLMQLPGTRAQQLNRSWQIVDSQVILDDTSATTYLERLILERPDNENSIH